jgi:hypothetical protein
VQRRVLPARLLAGLLGTAAVLAIGVQSVWAAVPTPGLLDQRGWELVSPVEKNGGEVASSGEVAGGGLSQGAADGQSATFSSSSSFAAPLLGAPYASQYIARRGDTGWSTENVTQPSFAGAYGEAPDGVPYRVFSPDLGRGLILNATACEAEEDCPRSYSSRESSSGALALSPEAPDLELAGASADLSSVVLSSCEALTPDATEVPDGGGCDTDFPNLYRWRADDLALIDVLPGASLAAPLGAVSTDGNRIYWTQGGDLYLREGSTTKQVDDSQGGGGDFQAATPTGAFGFFTKAGHLYRYDALADSATDLTPAGEVVGMLGASPDGSRAYFQTDAGLFAWSAGTTTEVAPGTETAQPSDYPPATATARLSADGARLAFLSKSSLTGYDNTDQLTGEPDSQLFLYDASAKTLTCVSCNPKGARPIGPAAIPGALANGTTMAYRPRAFVANGTRLFFESGDALVNGDTNQEPDVYEWEAQGAGSCTAQNGCLGLISSGRSEEGASFVDASEDGADVFFLTDGSLVPGDPGAVDLYDARVGGGFLLPPDPIPCEGDACQPLPSPPEDPTPGTQVPTGGNPPVSFPKTGCPKGKRAVVRKGKRRCVKRGGKKGQTGKVRGGKSKGKRRGGRR